MQKYAKLFYSNDRLNNKFLFTTSFGDVNSFHGGGVNEYLEILKKITKKKKIPDSEFYRFEMNKEFFIQYENLLNDLINRFPNEKILFRPHLSENINY